MSNLSAFIYKNLGVLPRAATWCALLAPMGVVVGSLCAGFLWSLDVVTRLRLVHPALLYALPVVGLLTGMVYARFGRGAEAGNNLIVDEIHEPGAGVPARMAPLILVFTVLSHLGGASVGREGTAVQMGGSIASAWGRMCKLSAHDTRIVLMAGIAAGFGAVFGTPVAGAVFALEVLAIGQMEYTALVPALAAAIIADWTCHAWGIHHVAYHIGFMGYMASGRLDFQGDPLLFAKVIVAGIAFGLVGWLFCHAAHRIGAFAKRMMPQPWLRPMIGGIATIVLVMLLGGDRDYLGLGVVPAMPGGAAITSFFGPQVFLWSWLLKLIFTLVAIGTGFKGGEVTPLFFIGAALGNALACVLHAPADLFAGLGFVALFASTANTPLACTLMGIELFGSANAVPIAIACFTAYLCSGHSGIYPSQRIGVPKRFGSLPPNDMLLRALRQSRPDKISATPTDHSTGDTHA